jgi:hypothetical protein
MLTAVTGLYGLGTQIVSLSDHSHYYTLRIIPHRIPKLMNHLLRSLFLLLLLLPGITLRATGPLDPPAAHAPQPLPPTPPEEGMWIPMLISQNYEQMKALGLKLTPEQIYSVNNSSLKDAVVSFGGFCTGEIISGEGLILTNHHCGYDAIQSLSSTQHDYLTDGFWAMNRGEELQTDLSVSFLVRMENITDQVMDEIKKASQTATLGEGERNMMIEMLKPALAAKASEDGKYRVEIKDFFFGSEYYLFVYQDFTDVRLVGAPPSSIGKYGGDTDNWMWPRHTGDFSFFRVYADKDGNPADYSADNVPLKPKHFFPVSLRGIQENDFSMIMGYPGSTDRYACADDIQMAFEVQNPARIKIREARLNIMKRYMDQSDAVRIQYASKYAQISNYYKYFIGQNQGLKRLGTIDFKRAEHAKFQAWADADPSRHAPYGHVLKDLEAAYKNFAPVALPSVYIFEAGLGSDLMTFGLQFNRLHRMIAAPNPDQAAIDTKIAELREMATEHFTNYNLATDRELFEATIGMYYNDIPADWRPSFLNDELQKKFKGNVGKYTERVYGKSFLTSLASVNAFLDKPSLKRLEADPGFAAAKSLVDFYLSKLMAATNEFESNTKPLYRAYIEGMRKIQPDRKFYPDANFTLRLTYGTVKSYEPMDAVTYKHITFLEGLMEKEDPTNDEFIVPQRLKDLYAKRDYGQYAVNGRLPVCFLTTTDITGGNSGSPVLNANGELIGVAFDGNWEAMTGDLVFDADLKRTINVDIRYVLFIVDKFAGAGHLLSEMKIVR